MTPRLFSQMIGTAAVIGGQHSGAAQVKNDHTLVTCPRCNGDGEEPGAPIDLELGTALCNLCHGKREVRKYVADRYEEEQE